MKPGKALLGVLAGMAAGAALGLLFAPDSGSETRKKISKKGKDLAGAVNNKIDEKFDELITAITGKVRKTQKQNESEANKVSS